MAGYSGRAGFSTTRGNRMANPRSGITYPGRPSAESIRRRPWGTGKNLFVPVRWYVRTGAPVIRLPGDAHGRNDHAPPYLHPDL